MAAVPVAARDQAQGLGEGDRVRIEVGSRSAAAEARAVCAPVAAGAAAPVAAGAAAGYHTASHRLGGREIATLIGRAPSTVSREPRRNTLRHDRNRYDGDLIWYGSGILTLVWLSGSRLGRHRTDRAAFRVRVACGLTRTARF